MKASKQIRVLTLCVFLGTDQSLGFLMAYSRSLKGQLRDLQTQYRPIAAVNILCL